MTQSANDTVIVERFAGHVVARIDRPHSANALNAEVVEALHAVIDDVEATPRILVITSGSPGVFVGGSDIEDLARRRRHEGLIGPVVRLLNRVASTPLPSIAAIDGPAIGGGAELAYACDLRIGTARARFAQPEPALGIIAGAGATWRLPTLVGASVAKQVLLGGRELDAESALRSGLLMAVVEPEELMPSVLTIVERLARWSSDALRLTKLCTDAAPGAHPQIDLVAQAALFEDPGTRERLETFVASRRRRAAERGR